MDWVIFALIVLALIGVWILLNRLDKRSKNSYKKNAYRLLDTDVCTVDDVKKCIKMLRLYGGRFRKDKEFVQLVNRLIDKLDKMEGREARQIDV